MENIYKKPFWWVSEESAEMLERGYLLPNQTIEEKVRVKAKYASELLKRPDLEEPFFNMIAMGWTSLSSPIWANFGESRGLPISCVTGDTWINTSTGGKMAKDIEKGDLVLTHKNRFKPVSAIIPTKQKDDIWKLKVGTRMTNLYITGNHPVLTNLGWVKVEELDIKKHLVAVNGLLEYEGSDYTIDLKPFVSYEYVLKEGNIYKAVENNSEKSRKKNINSEYVTYYSSPKEFVDIDEDLAWALGVWFAEGSVAVSNKREPNGVRITLNDKDEAWVAEKWLSIMSDRFNLNGNTYASEVIRRGKKNSWLTVNFNGKVIGEFFNSFGKGAKNKVMPEWMINLPKDKLQKVLDGMLLGDGYKGKNGSNKITLANPKLLLQLYNIGLKLGHDMSLQMQEKAGKLSTTSHVYTLVFRGYEISTNRHSAVSGIKFKDGLTYCPIKVLEKTDKVEDVFDFTVEDDHSFSCAGVVVHNCFSSYIPDSIDGIFKSNHEVAVMTQQGGGTSGYFPLRPKGTPIKGGGKSSGAVSFVEVFNTTIKNVSQSGVRRGGFAAYMDIDHPEVIDFMRIKDKDSSMQSINTAVNVTDDFMNRMINGDEKAREVWAEVLRNRREKGIPYITFIDNVNKQAPDVYKDKGLRINQSNLCVAGDTKILTELGYKEIETLEGQFIDVWNGEEWSNVQIFKTGEAKELYEVTLSNGATIKATPEHKWYTQTGYTKGVGENKLKLEEKRTLELKEGDKMIKFALPVIEGNKTLKYAYTQGFFSGDGYCDENPMNSKIYLYNQKQDLLQFIVARNKFVKTSKNFTETEDKAVLQQEGRIVVHPPLDLIQNKSFVPDSSYTIKSRIEWLEGLFDSDGTLTDNGGSQSIQVGSVNRQFLIDTMLMLQTLGCDSKVTEMFSEGLRELPKNDGSGELGLYFCKKAYRLIINGNSLHNLVELGLKTKRLKPSGKKPQREASEFVKVISVVKLLDLYDTYCANEPKRHKLMFEGVLTGNCNEIYLHTSEDESLVCCLSSLNLATYKEWKDTNVVELLTYFLDAVLTDFIQKTDGMSGMERANRFAKKGRAIGIGVLGWHSFLQQEMVPFESPLANVWTKKIFKQIQEQSLEASKRLATEYGEPPLMRGYGRRNSLTTAVAPTTSSSAILGQVSPGIEPYKSNYYVVGLAKGSFPRINKELEKLLISKGKNTQEVWDSIKKNKGSVQHLGFLTEVEKSVFKTFEEIHPLDIIKQNALRQKYVDQGISLNVLIPNSVAIKDVNSWYIEAWRLGTKGLYYQRGTSVSKEALIKMQNCASCEA